MESTDFLYVIILVLIIGFFVFITVSQKKNNNAGNTLPAEDSGKRQLQLQAYERLVLLVDRIALPNIIGRVNQPGISAREMQMVLIQTIRQEFDYNITQQIYVSKEAWDAVKNLKEQNILVINQFANTLPPHATGLDLNKLLLEYLMNNKKGSLHEVVSEVLGYEAKKILV